MIREVRVHKIHFEDKRLGRHVVHDARSREFQEELPRTTEPLVNVQHRRYDPRPEPNQPCGCCTGVSEAMMFNTVGNRIPRKVLTMDDAIAMYSLATTLDPWTGSYPPTDTGSSGLAAAKAAVRLGFATHYVWYFDMPTLLRALQNHPISFGGVWHADMFKATWDRPVVRPTGEILGGHQWVLSGYNANEELISGECWWGPAFGRNGRFYISVPDFQKLFENRGDAHFTYRKMG